MHFLKSHFSWTRLSSLFLASLLVFAVLGVGEAAAIVDDAATKAYIKANEGFRAQAYTDNKGQSIGYGHYCGDNKSCNPSTITRATADDYFNPDYAKALSAAKGLTKSWDYLNANQSKALIDMCYQMGGQGGKGCAGFTEMIKALDAKDFETAAKEALNSKYARQTPDRAKRSAALIAGKEVAMPTTTADAGDTGETAAGASESGGSGASAGGAKPPAGKAAKPDEFEVSLQTSFAWAPKMICVDPTYNLKKKGSWCAEFDSRPSGVTCTIGAGPKKRFATCRGSIPNKKFICKDNVCKNGNAEFQINELSGQFHQVLRSKDGVSMLEEYAGLLYKWLAGIIGLVAVLMIVAGGVQISLAGGWQEAAESGKDRIMSALLGLAILFLSSLILYTINPNFFI